MKSMLASIALFVGTLLFAHAGEEPTDFDRMQGTWVIVSLIENGKAISAEEAAALEFVIEKDVYTAYEKGKAVVKYQFKLDPAKTPKQIDFTYLVGDDKGKTEPGIYTFDKDQIKFVLDENKKGRPAVFEGKETETCSVLVLKKKPK
jgi:uncharacterized protein (TIGR03067 family)